ncbi:ATP-NAD kinase-like domain-containing protein [Obelidium mucronatum]|nr:ATP-NAD kinase-like domain-containing protein [Obelidium mucronatum]
MLERTGSALSNSLSSPVDPPQSSRSYGVMMQSSTTTSTRINHHKQHPSPAIIPTKTALSTSSTSYSQKPPLSAAATAAAPLLDEHHIVKEVLDSDPLTASQFPVSPMTEIPPSPSIAEHFRTRNLSHNHYTKRGVVSSAGGGGGGGVVSSSPGTTSTASRFASMKDAPDSIVRRSLGAANFRTDEAVAAAAAAAAVYDRSVDTVLCGIGADMTATTTKSGGLNVNGKPQKRYSGLKKTHVRLANTAVGLREIAKKIGKRTLQWESPPKNILIVTKLHDPELVPFTKDLALWLISECQMTVLVEERLREYPEFSNFTDASEEYSIITDYGLSPPPANSQQEFPNANKSNNNSSNKGSASSLQSPITNLHFWAPEDFLTPLKQDPLSSKIDLIVTLGGDGTVLFTAGLFENVKVPPIVPFDLGSLGFLAVFEFEMAKETLRKVLGFPCLVPSLPAAGGGAAGEEDSVVVSTMAFMEEISLAATAAGVKGTSLPDMSNGNGGTMVLRATANNSNSPGVKNCLTGFNVNMRLRLACSIFRMDQESGELAVTAEETHHVLNEMVVDRGPSAYMSHLELFVDGAYLTTSMADGLVIATPTGSTAYSLSAGGSIVHPLVPALLVTPICPHTLSFRPMLLPESIELKVQVPRDARGTAWVSFDGKQRRELKQGDEVRVEVSRFGVPTVCRQDQSKDWIESLRRCLHWNVRTKQKEFK